MTDGATNVENGTPFGAKQEQGRFPVTREAWRCHSVAATYSFFVSNDYVKHLP
jgi:hypothetical protein